MKDNTLWTTFTNPKGLERPSLIGLTGAGLNHAWTTTKASAPCVKARQDNYIKGICSPWSKGLYPGKTQSDSLDLLLHSHQKDMSSFIFQMLQGGKYYLIFFIGHRNICIEYFFMFALCHFCISSDPLF